MTNIFPIDFEEKLTMAQDDYILFSDSEDGNKIKKAQYKNLKGEPGTPGTPGADGSAATITVGSVSTGAAGSSATVVNSGTSSAAVLDFTIPQGAKGEPGEDGDDGAAATITVGTTTTLSPGSSATVTNVGTSSAAILNFGIPKGDSGAGSGDVSGPASSTDGDVAIFDGNTGKLIKDGSVALSTLSSAASLASTAIQPGDDISDLNNDAGYTSNTGDVVGPASATDGHLALFDGATGKLIKDGGSVPTGFSPSNAGTTDQVLTKTAGGYERANATSGDSIEYVTSAEYTALLPGAESDGKHYFIYEEEVGPTPPSPWQPGVNTLGYRPFKSDLNEASGKTGLDWNIERGSVSYSNNMATINTLRISSMIFTGTGDYTILMYRTSSDTNFGFRMWCDSNWFPKQQLDIRGQAIFSGNTWYECFNSSPDTSLLLAVAVRENNDLYYYENGVLVNTTVAPSTDITGGPGISMGAFGTDNTSGSVGNLIVENKAWTQQEISDYFNQTKGDYGIS